MHIFFNKCMTIFLEKSDFVLGINKSLRVLLYSFFTLVKVLPGQPVWHDMLSFLFFC